MSKGNFIASCILCEDIRQEVAGKVSYIGVYQGDYVATSFPEKINQMMVIATVMRKNDDAPKPKTATARIQVPGGEDVTVKLPDVPQSIFSSPTSAMRVKFPFDAEVSEKGRLRIFIDTDVESILIGGLNIKSREELERESVDANAIVGAMAHFALGMGENTKTAKIAAAEGLIEIAKSMLVGRVKITRENGELVMFHADGPQYYVLFDRPELETRKLVIRGNGKSIRYKTRRRERMFALIELPEKSIGDDVVLSATFSQGKG